MRRLAAVGISIILVASACGSDDDSADTDTSLDYDAQGTGTPSQSQASPDTQATDAMSTTTTMTGSSGPLDEALLTQAVEEYVAAFGGGDPDAAVSLLSERCTDTIPMVEYRAAVASAGELYPGLIVDDFYDIVMDEDRAVVYYSTDPEVETEDGERWIIESGTWVWDDC